MRLKTERLPFKISLIVGVVAALFNGAGLFLWDFFKNEPLVWERYIFQAIAMGFFMAFIFRFKVTKEKENKS